MRISCRHGRPFVAGTMSVAMLLVEIALPPAAQGAVTSPGVVVSNPNVLPPPGDQFGWVDHPCTDQVRFEANWLLPTGETFIGTAVLANSMMVSEFGTPVMRTEGSDVITTFDATLDATVTTLFGEVQSHPLHVLLPGEMSVRLVGKAGKVTGAFLVVVEDMTFSSNAFLVRLDPTRTSRGVIAVTALAGGQYAIECGVDVYSMFSANPGADPPQWLPLCPDSYAPTHYELLAAACPTAGTLFAEFSYSPATPANSKEVAFTDESTGGATSWTWTFGDGTGSSERNPSHVYAAPGFYPVRLVVTNGAAASSKSSAIRIGPLWGHGGPRPRRALHGVPLTGTPHPVPRP